MIIALIHGNLQRFQKRGELLINGQCDIGLAERTHRHSAYQQFWQNEPNVRSAESKLILADSEMPKERSPQKCSN
jgi:hypothetical protein